MLNDAIHRVISPDLPETQASTQLSCWCGDFEFPCAHHWLLEGRLAAAACTSSEAGFARSGHLRQDSCLFLVHEAPAGGKSMRASCRSAPAVRTCGCCSCSSRSCSVVGSSSAGGCNSMSSRMRAPLTCSSLCNSNP